MTWAIVFFLAGLQGLAEFLPISSSGHLRVFETVLGLHDVPVLFDVMLHLGTLIAIVIVYRKLVGDTLRGAFRGITKPREAYADDVHFRLACHVLLAMVPTLLLVMALRTFAETWAHDLARVGATLLVTALVLLALQWRVRKNRSATPAADSAPLPTGRTLEHMTWRDALAIGTAQGMSATFRGLSRSGSTITTGVFVGLEQKAAASFSFLVSIPAIFGALVFSLRKFDGNTDVILYGLVGAAVAAVVGYFALRWLLKMLGSGRLYLFAGWCAAVGIFAIVWRFAAS